MSPQQADVSSGPAFAKSLLLLLEPGLDRPWCKQLAVLCSVGSTRGVSGARMGRVASVGWHLEFIFTDNDFSPLAL